MSRIQDVRHHNGIYAVGRVDRLLQPAVSSRLLISLALSPWKTTGMKIKSHLLQLEKAVVIVHLHEFHSPCLIEVTRKGQVGMTLYQDPY